MKAQEKKFGHCRGSKENTNKLSGDIVKPWREDIYIYNLELEAGVEFVPTSGAGAIEVTKN